MIRRSVKCAAWMNSEDDERESEQRFSRLLRVERAHRLIPAYPLYRLTTIDNLSTVSFVPRETKRNVREENSIHLKRDPVSRESTGEIPFLGFELSSLKGDYKKRSRTSTVRKEGKRDEHGIRPRITYVHGGPWRDGCLHGYK